MSKYLKNLVTQDIAQRLQGVQDALLVDVVGLDVNQSVQLRKRLREKDIQLLAIKNSLAARATRGTPLAAALEDAKGSLALVWGAEDFIALAKEIARLDEDSAFEAFKARGGVMEGEKLSAQRVKDISKWPSRGEQLSIVAGQFLSPGANLSGALLGPGAVLAGQIKEKSQDGADPQ
jgi:large subunit ribosomal protein L10